MNSEIKMTTDELRKEFASLLDTTSFYDNGTYYEEKASIIRNLILDNTPSQLFRFRSFNSRSLRQLYNNQIWGSIPHEFNDPYDSIFSVDYSNILNKLRERLTNIDLFKKELLYAMDYFAKNGLPPIIYDNFSKEQKTAIEANLTKLQTTPDDELVNYSTNALFYITDMILDNFVNNISKTEDLLSAIRQNKIISCFAEEIKNPLLWGHYGDGHKGFAIEYDFREVNKKCEKECKTKVCEDCKLLYPIYPVIYNEQRYDADFFYLDFIIGELYKLCNLDINTFDYLTYTKLCVYKSKEWAYEKEWRCLRPNSDKKAFDYFQMKPKAIYLGHKANENNIKLMKYICKINNWPLKQVKLSFVRKEDIINIQDIDINDFKLDDKEIAELLIQMKEQG